MSDIGKEKVERFVFDTDVSGQNVINFLRVADASKQVTITSSPSKQVTITSSPSKQVKNHNFEKMIPSLDLQNHSFWKRSVERFSRHSTKSRLIDSSFSELGNSGNSAISVKD